MSGPVSVLLDLLFPPRCVFCGRILGAGERDICAACQRGLPWLIEGAAEQKGEFFSRCVSPLRYEGDVRESIHRYKFKGISAYARVYGSLVAQCVRDHLEGEYDLITWVPLSSRRKKERGYDQAFLLAQSAAMALGDVAAETLRKTKHNRAQSGMEHEAARRANVMNAYQCIEPELVAGRRVLLIDDVITTGATISECARVLRISGACDVLCATLARAR